MSLNDHIMNGEPHIQNDKWFFEQFNTHIHKLILIRTNATKGQLSFQHITIIIEIIFIK